MGKNMEFSEIDWDAVDYSKVSHVCDICKVVKDHYWEKRPNGKMQSPIIESGKEHDFLLKAFETYHTEWYERTEGATKIDFFVAIPEGFHSENAKCFHLILDGVVPNDSAIAHRFSKSSKQRADIKNCCREAIKDDIQKVRTEYFGNTQSDKNVKKESIHIHHSGKSFSEIVNQWIEENGGVDYLYQFVNSPIGNGTKTEFTSEEIAENFRQFHNKHAVLVPLSEEQHKECHRRGSQGQVPPLLGALQGR